MKVLMENWRKRLKEEVEITGADYEPGVAQPTTEEPDVDILTALENILVEWEEAEYESDEERWKSYALDIQDLVDQYDVDDDEEEEEEVEEVPEELEEMIKKEILDFLEEDK